jgi:hypothetical protein
MIISHITLSCPVGFIQIRTAKINKFIYLKINHWEFLYDLAPLLCEAEKGSGDEFMRKLYKLLPHISVKKKNKVTLLLTTIIFIFAGHDRGADILLVIN